MVAFLLIKLNDACHWRLPHRDHCLTPHDKVKVSLRNSRGVFFLNFITKNTIDLDQFRTCIPVCIVFESVPGS